MNLAALDNAIAVVIVILSLSLVVQSIQAFLKKIFKIKSRQLEQSLVDLFHIALGTPDEKTQVRMALLQVRSGPAGLPPADSKHEVRILYDAVIRGFQEIGRVAASGKSMMDSVSKHDLLKVLRRVDLTAVLPGKAAELATACRDVAALGVALEETRGMVSDSAVAAKLAVLQEQFTPLLNDVKRIFDGQAVTPKVVVGDLVNLRGLKAAEVLEVVAAAQAKVTQDRSATAEGSPERAALDKILDGLHRISVAIEAVGQSAEAAVGGLSARIKQIDDWYDTVMQSFTERYARSMRTWGIVLGFLVAFALNADLFSIYRNISTNPQTRDKVLASYDALAQKLQQSNPAGAAPAGATAASGVTGPSGAPGTTGDQASTGVQGTTGVQAATGTSGVTGGTGEPTALAVITKAKQDVVDSASLYSTYGFGWPTGPDKWRDWSWVSYLFGCIAMGLLLSVGAPFWEDTLESLFGVKNLLGKKSAATQTVQTDSTQA